MSHYGVIDSDSGSRDVVLATLPRREGKRIRWDDVARHLPSTYAGAVSATFSSVAGISRSQLPVSETSFAIYGDEVIPPVEQHFRPKSTRRVVGRIRIVQPLRSLQFDEDDVLLDLD